MKQLMFKTIWKVSRAISHGKQRYLSYCAPLALLDQSNASPLKPETYTLLRILHCFQTLIHGCQVLAVFPLRGMGRYLPFCSFGTCHSGL